MQGTRTVLHFASDLGNLRFIELLLIHKANPKKKNAVTRGDGLEVARMVVGAHSCIVGV